MGLWMLQIMLNFLFGALGLAILLSRRDQKRLEAEVRRLRALVDAGQPTASSLNGGPSVSIPTTSVMESVGLAVSPPAPSAHRLLEKTSPPAASRPNYEAFDVAQKLLSRGLDVKEVSRRTGLSVAELHLMGKVSQKNH